MADKEPFLIKCTGCGKDIWAQRSTRRFCSECLSLRGASYQSSFRERHIKVCPCGNPVLNGSNTKMYCSNVCRREYGNYKRVEMKTAVCLGCGQEFSRPHHYPSKMRYCSTKCANMDIRKVRDKYVLTLSDSAVILKSGLEVRFLAVCLRFGLECRKFDGDRFTVDDGSYTPDFLVRAGGKEFVVEVKGTMLRCDEVAKVAYGRDNIDGYRVCFEEDIETMENGDLSFFSEQKE